MPTRAKRLRSNPMFLPGLCLALAVSFTAGGYLLSGWLDQQVERQYQVQQKRLREAQRRADISKRQLEIAQQYLARFREFQVRGVIGPTNRLNWSERLMTIGEQLGIQGLQFDFSSRQPMDKSYRKYFGVREDIYQGFDLNLSFQLQHEGDLLQLLGLIDRYISPMYILKSCSLDNLIGADQQPGFTLSGNLRGRCALSIQQVVPRTYDHG